MDDLEPLEQAYSSDNLLVVFDRLEDVKREYSMLQQRVDTLEEKFNRNRHSWFVAGALGIAILGAFIQVDSFILSKSGVEVRGVGRDFNNALSLLCAIGAIPLLGEDFLRKTIAQRLGLQAERKKE